MRRLAEHVQVRGFDDQARQTTSKLIRYFDTAARVHREDEEEDLLPRMIAASTASRGSSLMRMVADVVTEHREMARSWHELRATLRDVAANQQTLNPLQVDRFVKLYRVHLAMEESNLFPLAEMLLTRHDFADIGANMAERRAHATA